MELVQAALAGDRRAVARLITRIENNCEDVQSVLADLYPYAGRAYVIGVTGAPGAGKSTLVGQLAKAYRTSRPKVGVVAVDATSPFSGGAILGDRIRMRDLAGDSGIFVRSMATRGNLGGLASTTAEVVKVLDAVGYDPIIVETVGTGQAEIDIARLAHTVLVVEAPNMGDEIQALKAGILEIADILVVNKCDCAGAERTSAALEMMLSLDRAGGAYYDALCSSLIRLTDPPQPGMAPSTEKATNDDAGNRWRPRLVKTNALQGEGVPDLMQAIADHRHYLEATHERQRRDWMRVMHELEQTLYQALMKRLLDGIDQTHLTSLLARVAAREIDPYAAVRQLIAQCWS